MTNHGAHTQVLTAESDWDQLAESWDELLTATSGSTALQRFAFLRSWWRHFSDDKTLFIVVAMRNGVITGIAPLQLTNQTIVGLRYRVLEFIGMPDELDRPHFLVADGDTATLNLLLDAISDNRNAWDMVQLDEVETNHWQFSLLANWAKTRDLWLGQRPLHTVPYLEKEGSWQDFLESKSRRFRKRLRDMERKVRQLHKLTYTAAHGGKDIEPLIQDFVAVERRSWKYTEGLDIGYDRAYRDFYRDLLTADSAALQGHALVQYFDGHPSAATLGFSSDSVYYSLQIAHDSDFDALSPGTLLEAAEMQWFFDEPSFTTYEFLGGDGPNKRRWTRASIATNTQIIAKTGFRSLLARNLLFHVRPALTRHWDRKTKSS